MATETLGVIADVVMGQSPPGEMCNVAGEGLPLLNGPTEFGPHHPSPAQFTTAARKHSAPGDILFCVRGSTTGRMNWADREYAIGRGIAAIRHKRGPEYQPFLRALIEYHLPELLVQATGSTFPNVAYDQLVGLTCEIPLPVEQRAIARILGTLDDKIELNRRMNETLEAIARAIFKSWFVDFDPVRAKAEGRQPAGMDAETAALFPSHLQESEIGEIPVGWRISCIYRIAGVKYGNPFSSRFFNPRGRGLPLIRIRDLAAHDPSIATSESLPKQVMVIPGDIVAGMDGEFRVHHWHGPTSLLNQRLCKFEPREGVPRLYLSEAIKPLMEFFERSKVGTTVTHLGKSDIDTMRVLQPSRGALQAFGRITEPILDATTANVAQSRTLAAIRDALLPRLISGEIRVEDAEKLAEETT